MAQNAQQRQFTELMTNLGQATEALAQVAAQTARQQEQLTQAMDRVNAGPVQGAEGPPQAPPQGSALPLDTGGKVLKAPDTFSPNTIGGKPMGRLGIRLPQFSVLHGLGLPHRLENGGAKNRTNR